MAPATSIPLAFVTAITAARPISFTAPFIITYLYKRKINSPLGICTKKNLLEKEPNSYLNITLWGIRWARNETLGFNILRNVMHSAMKLAAQSCHGYSKLSTSSIGLMLLVDKLSFTICFTIEDKVFALICLGWRGFLRQWHACQHVR